ncbi:hypothetical protein DUNSADRAFT_15106 [Dunaliella salina]|uniref:Uncharacterized protein n=1 Tax=Dunaliella salina TaxID=3046 RepID=A0ABQ7H220_DUNSA|nr:hypothetical protein DUNSADRAFT_15106 [Dunaliella salina]|eukprot:KAF5840906.1 hypothetical protein DUNSADRAFT_15106 [Dunaliella salina]
MLPHSHTVPSDISARKVLPGKNFGCPCKRSSVHVAIPRQSRPAHRLRLRLQSTEKELQSTDHEQAEPQAPGPAVAEGGLPNESYSRFKVGMALACRVVQLRPGQGAFVQLLPTDWAETVPPKMAYLPQSEFTHGAPKNFAIENVLPKGALIKAHIFKISTRGILISTRSLEKRAGDMLTAPLECFERARSLEVGQILPADSWHLSEMPQLDNLDESGEDNQAKKRKKAIKRLVRKGYSNKLRVVIADQYTLTKKGRLIRNVRSAAWPLQPFQGAAQVLSSTTGKRWEANMEPYVDAAEDVMSQHVRQALLTPPSMLELQPISQDREMPISPSSDLQDAFPAIHSLAAAQVRLRSVPGGADALVPQHSLQPRSMGRAPHEPASVTMRSCSLALEGELINKLVFIIGLPQGVVVLESWHRAIPLGWGRTAYVSGVAHLASDMRRTFPDQKRWSLLVRDAFMGASSRILALTDVPHGPAYGTSSASTQPSSTLSGSSPEEKVNKTKMELEGGPQLGFSGRRAAIGRWRALALSLLQLAKAEFLSMPAPSNPEGCDRIQASDSASDSLVVTPEVAGMFGMHDIYPYSGEERQHEQQESREAKKAHPDTLHRHPALLPSLALVAGVGGADRVRDGVESDAQGSKDQSGLSSIWSSAGLDLFEDPVRRAGSACGQGDEADNHADDEYGVVRLPPMTTESHSLENRQKRQEEKQREREERRKEKEREHLSSVLRSSPLAADVLEFLACGVRDSCMRSS